MATNWIETLSELEKSDVVDCILPGISVFLDVLLSKEQLSDELESLRSSYAAILCCAAKTESLRVVRQLVESLAAESTLKPEANTLKGSTFGRVKEKRLINIRQFHFGKNQRKQERRNRMEGNDDSRVVTNTDDESRLSTKKQRRACRESSETKDRMGLLGCGAGKESRRVPNTDDECRSLTTTDDERRVSTDGESFVELSKSQNDLTAGKYEKLVDVQMSNGPLYHKEGDGWRERWFILEERVLKCYQRQNLQNLIFEMNLEDGDFSAIQGRIGKMFALRLSGIKTSSSHLFASPKAETIASWVVAFSRAGVRLQDEILREVSMNQQNNNKVKWSFDGEINLSEKDEIRSELLEASEFIDRSHSACILPKRSSYSFKELDVLKKLKCSLVAKKAESKLNRRKTWSAGTFPISNCAMLERFRKPTAFSDGNSVGGGKKGKTVVQELASKILTSSGVMQIPKECGGGLETSGGSEGHFHGSIEECCYAKWMPEGLNNQHESNVRASQLPCGSISAHSVPDLLILPNQETPVQSTPKPVRQLKPRKSLTRVMSMKASLMKNAIMSGLKRKGRRGSGPLALNSDIHGCLFRKKGLHWKQRWCAINRNLLYVFRDPKYTLEDFRCSLSECSVMSSVQDRNHAYALKLVWRKVEEIIFAAENASELQRWKTVLLKETSKLNLCEGNDSRSFSLTVSLFESDAIGDSSAAEDTPLEAVNQYSETMDKDSSDELSTASSISSNIKSRGRHEKGYVYYLGKQDTWEHCWMEVSFGVLSIYNNERKDTALQRDHVALCDIQHDSSDGQWSFLFVLKKPGRHPVYFAVDSPQDFLKWEECFKSWKKRTSEESHPGLKNTDVVPSRVDFLAIPRTSPICRSPATSDSECYAEGNGSKATEVGRPKIRRSMTDVLSQTTPKFKRRSLSNAENFDNASSTTASKNAIKSSYLYYKASSGLWVKYWCVLDSAVVYCFNSPEDGTACFCIEIQGCDIHRTSSKSKHFTFNISRQGSGGHHEFAGESTYVMYGWIRVLKIAAGVASAKISISDETTVPASEELGIDIAKKPFDNDELFESKNKLDNVPASPARVVTSPRTSSSAPTSPKKKPKITSLDEVLQLLHEKQLEQELQTKELSKSERARMKWQHSMLVGLRKTRGMRAPSTSENRKSTGSFGSTEQSAKTSELNEKAAKVKYLEISAKYDDILENERLKMLRRETLLKKRRNSLILHQDKLQKKLGIFDGSKEALRKRQSKSDAKEMPVVLTKAENEAILKQLADINIELDGIERDIASNLAGQRKVSEDLNEQKCKELHELRISVDMSPQTSKTNLTEGRTTLHRRQASDSSLTSGCRKVPRNGDRLPLSHTMSSPGADFRSKAKSFSTPVPKVQSSPLLRTKTYDGTDGSKKPQVKSRKSKEALSLALSQIEDFEAYVQDLYRGGSGQMSAVEPGNQ